jgi:DNA-binding HxlR family transcriptional regulator
VLDIIANKWTVLIIGALSNGTRRFQQLRREVDGVTQKMLTQTLRALERDGLVGRRIYATVPPRVEYSLTRLGHTITGLLWAVREWAETHVEEIEASRAAWDAPILARGVGGHEAANRESAATGRSDAALPVAPPLASLGAGSGLEPGLS